MLTEGLFTSRTDEWATPASLFAELDAEFHFNLDPCSTHENAKCEKHYTIEDDGLTKNWGGTEFSATLHTGGPFPPGCGSAPRKPGSQAPSSSCSSRQGRILPTSTITSTTEHGRFVSSEAGFTSTRVRTRHRSHP